MVVCTYRSVCVVIVIMMHPNLRVMLYWLINTGYISVVRSLKIAPNHFTLDPQELGQSKN